MEEGCIKRVAFGHRLLGGRETPGSTHVDEDVRVKKVLSEKLIAD